LEVSPARDGTLRYAPYHASLVEFLCGRSPAGSAADVASVAGYPLARELRNAAASTHGRIADRYLNLWGGLDDGLPLLIDAKLAEVDAGYGLSHLGTHLAAAGRADDLYRLLAFEIIDGGAHNAWFHVHDRYGDLTGFVNDIDVAVRHVQQENNELLLLGRPAPDVALEIRYALIHEALTVHATNIPNYLLPQLVETRIWSATRALAYARRIRDAKKRSQILAGLAAQLSERERYEALAEALKAAVTITDELARANALEQLAPYLPDPLQADALTAARNITFDYVRGSALAGLAPYLAEPLLADALRDARSITQEYPRWEALEALIPHLPARMLTDALTAAYGIADENGRARLLITIAPRLAEPERAGVVFEALTTSRSILQEEYRAQGLVWLAPHLPRSQLGYALITAYSIESETARIEALVGLAMHISGPERASVLSDALATARALTHPHVRAHALARLAAGRRLG
jgi:hypothetical protein